MKRSEAVLNVSLIDEFISMCIGIVDRDWNGCSSGMIDSNRFVNYSQRIRKRITITVRIRIRIRSKARRSSTAQHVSHAQYEYE